MTRSTIVYIKKSLKRINSMKGKICLLKEQLSDGMGLHTLSLLIYPGILWGRVFRDEEIGAG